VAVAAVAAVAVVAAAVVGAAVVGAVMGEKVWVSDWFAVQAQRPTRLLHTPPQKRPPVTPMHAAGRVA
jgi:hypothetical protein